MPPPARLGDANRWSEEAWERFAEKYRRQRAPEALRVRETIDRLWSLDGFHELRQRVIAAIRAAAAAGSWQELLDAGETGRERDTTRALRRGC